MHNPQDLYYGRLPRYRLSELGRKQARAAAEALTGAPLSAIYSSPLLRTRQTAQFIQQLQPPGVPLRVSALLLEVNTPHDGRPVSEMEATGWDLYSGLDARYEQPAGVLARALRFVEIMRERRPGQNIAAVTHGDLIAFLSLWAQDQPLEYKRHMAYPQPGSLTTLFFSGSGAEKPAFTYLEPAVR